MRSVILVCLLFTPFILTSILLGTQSHEFVLGKGSENFVGIASIGAGRFELYRLDFDDRMYFMPSGDYEMKDGYFFLYMNQASEEDFSSSFLSAHYGIFQYVDVEIRLRCSDDNRLMTGTGGGQRYWGYETWDFDDWLTFVSLSPESIAYSGFWASSGNRYDHDLMKSIEEVNMTQWHTYTILWEENAALFLIDGIEVGRTTTLPRMGAVNIGTYIPFKVWLSNEAYGGLPIRKPFPPTESFLVNVPHNVTIQIDHIAFSMSQEEWEPIQTEITDLFARAWLYIEEAIWMGAKNTEIMKQKYSEAEAIWEERHDYPRVRGQLHTIIQMPFPETNPITILAAIMTIALLKRTLIHSPKQPR